MQIITILGDTNPDERTTVPAVIDIDSKDNLQQTDVIVFLTPGSVRFSTSFVLIGFD